MKTTEKKLRRENAAMIDLVNYANLHSLAYDLHMLHSGEQLSEDCDRVCHLWSVGNNDNNERVVDYWQTPLIQTHTKS